MDLKALFSDDRAVSPVIGVILMVAITVILAAVIGTFVLGLGDSVQQTTPQATFSFDYDNNGEDNATVGITHDGGDRIDGDRMTTNVAGTEVNESTEDYRYAGTGWGETVSAGSSVTVEKRTEEGADWDGESIRVVWTSQDGSSSSTIGRSTAPS